MSKESRDSRPEGYSESHKRWLKVTALVVGSFGPIFFLSTMREYSLPSRLTLDLLGLSQGANNFDAPTSRFLSALTGGFLLGWGVTIYKLSGRVYDLAPEATRQAVLAGLLSWFCLDSMGSIASGNASNALWNVGVLALAVGPMWFPAKTNKD